MKLTGSHRFSLPFTRAELSAMGEIANSPIARDSAYSRALRIFTFVLLLPLIFFTVTVLQTQTQAYALALPPIVPTLPAGIGTGILTGAGETVATGTTIAEAAAGGGALVAAAPVVVAVGAGLALGGAIYLGWKWATGHDPGYADPPSTGPIYLGQSQTYSHAGQTVSFTLGQTAYTGSPHFSIVPGFGTGTTYVDLGVSQPVGSCGPCNWQVSFWNGGTPVGNLAFAGQFSGNGFGTYTVPIEGSNKGTVTEFTGVDNYNAANASPQTCAWYVYSCQAVHMTPSTNTGSSTAGNTTITTTPTSQCSGGGSVAGPSITYTGNTAPSDLPPILVPACPAGQTRTGFTTPSTGAGGATVPAPMSWTAPTIPSGFPECQGAASCQLNLFRVGHGTGIKHSCAEGGCQEWQTQAQRVGPKTTVKRVSDGTDIQEVGREWPNGDDMECQWGPYVIEVDGCKTVPTEDNPNQPTPGPTDNGESTCFPHGWQALNPFAWVYMPVKCALIWAFKPPAGTFDEWQSQVDDITNSPPVAIVTAGTNFITGIVTIVGTPSSCATNPGPIQWCQIISGAGDWAEESGWGQALVALEKTLLTVGFIFYWYNRITASVGSKSAL